jgi:endonuclease YncB( thermonuclease family)
MKKQNRILTTFAGRTYPVLHTFVLLVAAVLITTCSKYEKAAERLDFFKFETFSCSVLRVDAGNIFLCTPPDGEVDKIRLIGIRIPEDKEREAKKFSESVLRRSTLVKIEPDAQLRYASGGVPAYVFVPGGKMLNVLLIENGYAEIAAEEISEKYNALFLDARQYDKNKVE